jgi:heme-degrading monooxygenase HmoA
MIHEIAEIDVTEGHEAEFEAAVRKAAPLFKVSRGCRSFALTRSIEHPQRYRLTVGWDTVEDHMVHFRESEAFQGWRALVGPYFASPPRVEHVATVIDGF